MCVVAVYCTAVARTWCYAVTVGCNAISCAGFLNVETHAILHITLLVVVFVVGVVVVIAFEVGNKRMVAHRTSLAYCAAFAHNRPSKKDCVALRKLICGSVGNIVRLKRVVLNHLRTDATIERLVDVFKKDTAKGRTNLDAERFGIDTQLPCLGLCRNCF